MTKCPQCNAELTCLVCGHSLPAPQGPVGFIHALGLSDLRKGKSAVVYRHEDRQNRYTTPLYAAVALKPVAPIAWVWEREGYRALSWTKPDYPATPLYAAVPAVPREPTEAMIDAGMSYLNAGATKRETTANIYKAMYDAAVVGQELLEQPLNEGVRLAVKQAMRDLKIDKID